MQFRERGRERVIRRMWGCGKDRRVKEVGGGGDLNVGREGAIV